MNRRLLDRYVLADVRNVGRSLQILQPLESGLELRLEISLLRKHSVLDEPPSGAKHAFELTLTLECNAVASEDPSQKYYAGSVAIRALLVTESDQIATADEVNSSAHAVARFLYPVARMELFRLFCGAKVTDAPIPWDLGAEISAKE